MKKIVAVITALSILGASGISCMAYSDVSKDSQYYSAVEKLSDFDIINGYDDGTFKPDKTITRAEAACLITKAMNEVASYEKGKLGFSDVSDDFWAAENIYSVKNMNIMDGYEDGAFRPYQTITYKEFCKMAVCMVGYGADAESNGGYPQGYMMYAAQLGITEGISSSYDAEVTRGIAAVIISNTVEVPVKVVTGYVMDEDGKATTVVEQKNGTGNDYQTILTMRHGIYKVSGSVEVKTTPSPSAAPSASPTASPAPKRGTSTPAPTAAVK